MTTSTFQRVQMGGVGTPLPDLDILAGQAPQFAGDHLLVGDRRLSASWLRDNCPCAECRITQTDERRLQPWTHERPEILGTKAADAGFGVHWRDGHMSTYDSRWQESVNRALRRGSYEAHLWRDGYELTRIDHDAAIDDEPTQRSLFEAFVRDGAVVITGSPTVPGSVIEFMKKLRVTLIDSSLGFIFDVKLDPKGYNVAFTSEELPLHNDNAQYAQPPSGQVLAMLVNDASGGETMLADGWAIAEQLLAESPGAVDVLSSIDVGFRQYSDDADGFYRSPILVRNNRDQFTHLRFSNQLLQPIAFDHPRIDEWYDAYRHLGRLIHDRSNRVEFRLRGGDMLMVNGYRMLHARKAFRADGPRHLQDVYFCAQDVFDNLARLTGDAVDAMQR